MLKRRLLQTLVASMIAGLSMTVGAQPASAATVVPAGASGNACSPYEEVTTNRNIYWQEAIALTNLGIAENGIGRSAAAVAAFELAVTLTREVGDRTGEANALQGLA